MIRGNVKFSQPTLKLCFRTDPLEEVIESDGRIDPDKLEVWMTRNLVDPKDPDNVELMQRVTEANIRQASWLYY